MNCYCIFDDLGNDAEDLLRSAGIDLTIHPKGVDRPCGHSLKKILENYDSIILGTSQKITCEMFDNVNSNKIISTASIGTDHIQIPDNKKKFITVCNTPNANVISVAEYIIGQALLCSRRLVEGDELYREGKDNKKLSAKPRELYGKTIGIIGAGNISKKLMEYAAFFGMKIICWTRNPDNHSDCLNYGVEFVSLKELCTKADVISVNLPNKKETQGIISAELIDLMKNDAVFISISRIQSVKYEYLFEKACKNPNFYICLDIDVSEEIVAKIPENRNIFITPHIGGGTVEARQRMFLEAAKNIVSNKL